MNSEEMEQLEEMMKQRMMMEMADMMMVYMDFKVYNQEIVCFLYYGDSYTIFMLQSLKCIFYCHDVRELIVRNLSECISK